MADGRVTRTTTPITRLAARRSTDAATTRRLVYVMIVMVTGAALPIGSEPVRTGWTMVLVAIEMTVLMPAVRLTEPIAA